MALEFITPKSLISSPFSPINSKLFEFLWLGFSLFWLILVLVPSIPIEGLQFPT